MRFSSPTAGRPWRSYVCMYLCMYTGGVFHLKSSGGEKGFPAIQATSSLDIAWCVERKEKRKKKAIRHYEISRRKEEKRKQSSPTLPKRSLPSAHLSRWHLALQKYKKKQNANQVSKQNPPPFQHNLPRFQRPLSPNIENAKNKNKTKQH